MKPTAIIAICVALAAVDFQYLVFLSFIELERQAALASVFWHATCALHLLIAVALAWQVARVRYPSRKLSLARLGTLCGAAPLAYVATIVQNYFRSDLKVATSPYFIFVGSILCAALYLFGWYFGAFSLRSRRN